MTPCYVDIETFSELDLLKVGTARYAEHPSTRILMVSWGIAGEIFTWDESQGDGPPVEFLDIVNDPQYRIHAWNIYFETTLLRGVWGVEIPLWRQHCDMVHALSLALPGSLMQCGLALGFDESDLKQTDGSRLISKFSKSRKPTKNKDWTRNTFETDPEDWAKFVYYNRQDVVAEAKIHQRIKRWTMPDREWEYWMLDQTINNRGLPIDMDLVDAACWHVERNKTDLVEQLRDITHLHNPNSVQQLISWLNQRGVETETLDKYQVATLLEGELPDDARKALELRQELGLTSVSKFEALKRATSNDRRLRGTLQFYGASRTGRWSGRVFQPQNLPGGTLYGEALHEMVDTIKAGNMMVSNRDLQDCIRSCIRAPEGKLLVVADLANIESRILGWLAGAQAMLAVFADPSRDIYRDYGQELLQKPEFEITKAERKYCKPPSLGCGYGLGSKGLVAYADGMGVTMTPEEAQRAVDVFRSRYHEVPALWRKLEAATMRLVSEGKGKAKVGALRFEMDAPFLFMVLPSGRKLAYLQPRIEKREAPWGDEVDTLTYMGVDQYTRKWTRLTTFGGKWVEQACQAISRDLLAHGMNCAELAGFEVVGSVHDELIALADADDWRCHETLSTCMTISPDWADNLLFLAAEGFSDVIYRKD